LKLPNLDQAVIADTKIIRYLLDETHPKGRHKAIFFTRFGFSPDKWRVLRDTLLDHAHEHEIAKQVQSTRGMSYVIDGVLKTPDGRMPVVRVIWYVEHGGDIPHLVTAYPLKR
jgi:hypothetical protein